MGCLMVELPTLVEKEKSLKSKVESQSLDDFFSKHKRFLFGPFFFLFCNLLVMTSENVYVREDQRKIV